MLLLLTVSLFFSDPIPLEMPRATAYLVTDGATRQLQDNFKRLDLWTSQTVDGRWIDEDDRLFLLATLAYAPPDADAEEATVTRTDYRMTRAPIVARKPGAALREAIVRLSPVEVAEAGERLHKPPLGYRDVRYWQGTNASAIVCTYLREKSDVWRFALWQLAEGDDFRAAFDLFHEALRTRRFEPVFARTDPPRPVRKARTVPGERELLRADARHAVAAYGNWHVTDATEFSVLDDLGDDRSFVTVLTNDLAKMRARYAAVLPTGVDGTNVLAVARLFASRAEYLEALEADGLTNMNWSAAYWSPVRRELVAYLPQQGEEQLLKTIRHEAFHQYFSYATAMMPTSPWLNEGYAQYFEDEESPPSYFRSRTPDELQLFAKMIPALLLADYAGFYGGSDSERSLKYALAHAIVWFLEKRADAVRFKPFKDVKRDYLRALFKTEDPALASTTAFKNAETLKLFLAHWVKACQDL